MDAQLTSDEALAILSEGFCHICRTRLFDRADDGVMRCESGVPLPQLLMIAHALVSADTLAALDAAPVVSLMNEDVPF